MSRLESHPDEELLAAVALGDLDDLDADQLEHVQVCPDCAAVIAELREVATLASAAGQVTAMAAPPGVWQRVEHETSGHRADRRRHLSWVAAAAAVLLAGGGFAAGRWSTSGEQSTSQVMARARLDPYGTHRTTGAAEMRRDAGRILVDVRASRLGSGTGPREVWLINTDGKRMVSLGFLRADGRGEFEAPAELYAKGYRIVDVSQESYDGNPRHSGDSLARGTLTRV